MSEVIDPALLTLLTTHGKQITKKELPGNIVSREAWEDHIIRVFMKYYKPNPLILGDAGVGKTSLLFSIMDRFINGKVPDGLKDAVILFFDFKTLEDSFFDDLSFYHADLLKISRNRLFFFVDNFNQREAIMGSMAEIMKTYDILICCAAGKADYTNKLETEERVTEQMHKVSLTDPSDEEMMIICERKITELSKHYRLEIPPSLCEFVVSSAREAPLKGSLPKRVLEVLDAACGAAAFKGDGRLENRHIQRGVRHIVGIGAEFSSPGDTNLYLDGLEKKLNGEILGQNEAVKAVCNVVKLAKNGLDLRPERPDGVFLFTGPTGVGKTALVQSLAKHLSGESNNFVRLDMSEFSENATLSRLLGAPPGYIGSDTDSLLYTLLKDRPSAVILLDEFEKAHPQIHNFFLQIFDAGRFTDNSGVTMDMSHTTIIATCNVLEDSDLNPIGFQGEPDSEKNLARIPWRALKNVFPIELLNRFDEIIPFKPLETETCRRILQEIVIHESGKRVEERYEMHLDYSEAVLNRLLEEGFSRELGFRNVQRVFQRLVLLPLVDYMDGGNMERYRGRRVKIISLGEDFKLED